MTTPAAQPRPPAIRVELDPDTVGRAFTSLVLALAEAIRELMERQAIRRVEAGDLDSEQIERLGSALLAARRQLAQLRESLDEQAEEPQHRKDV